MSNTSLFGSKGFSHVSWLEFGASISFSCAVFIKIFGWVLRVSGFARKFIKVPFFPLGRDVSSCRRFDEVIFRWRYDACWQSDQVVFYFCWGYILRSGWWIFLILRFVKKSTKSFIFALVVFFHISDPNAAIVLEKVCCD